jgi:putative glycosyltransferase (TIGR04372 family)
MMIRVFDWYSRLVVKIRVLVSVVLARRQQEGTSKIILRILRRGLWEFCWILSLPLSAALHLSGVRRLNVRVEHIGHLAEEINTHLKERYLNLLPKRFWFVLAPFNRVSNQHLLNYWRAHVFVIQMPLLCTILRVVTFRLFAVSDLTRYTAEHFGTQDIYRVCRLWDGRPPILHLSDEDEVWSLSALKKIGIEKGKWFVCVHVREGGFLPHNDMIQEHRNANISATYLAMQEIVSRGGVCVRMGDPTMKRLPQMKNVIDYAHLSCKSPRLDVILCAKAKFFLGGTSGIAFVSTAFGVPVAHANMIPIAARGINRKDISIHKLLRHTKSGHYLGLAEIFSSLVANMFFTYQYRDAELDVIENSEEDILDLVLDMFDQLDCNGRTANEDKLLVDRYLSYFRPGHYGYGAISKVSSRFLRRRQNILFQ